ncbi:MAG: RNA 2',3'-cyclic phosphodiesterase [Deltaproteobacteria bacterium]|nr:RNA 2',3'-cyclic phosphodiesterase [Deltaproteobacteria bacterium]
MRIFIAALIPDEIRTQLANYIDSLKRNVDGVKWEKSDKLHITLKFLGDVDVSRVDEISNLLGKLVHGYSPFNLSISDFGGFPNFKSPRVLYIGLSRNNELSKFQNELERDLHNLGFNKEDRRFIPHITLARVKKRIHIRETLPITQSIFDITQIGLIKSELGAEGSVYTPLNLFELGK